MKTFRVDLDVFCELLFYKMEDLSQGSNSHEFRVKADTHDKATVLTLELLTPFIKEQLKEI